MAWIELHQTLWTHRKTLTLADALGIDDTYAAAHVARLWCWALDNAFIDYEARQGHLSGLAPRVIAAGAGWRGDAPAFVRALADAGFLDEADGRLVLHDWWDYAGKYLEQRQKDAARMRAARAANKPAPPAEPAPEVPSSIEERAPDVRRTFTERSPVTVPNLTVPNQTLKPEVVLTETSAPGGAVPPAEPAPEPVAVVKTVPVPKPPTSSERFERAFWAHYPACSRRRDKAGAYQAWKRAGLDAASPDEVQAVTDSLAAWAASHEWQKEGGAYIPLPATFLNGRQWEVPAPSPAASSRASPNGNGHRGQPGDYLSSTNRKLADMIKSREDANGRAALLDADGQAVAVALPRQVAR